MSKSFAVKETEKIFQRRISRKLPQSIQPKAGLKLEIADAAETLHDLTIPPGKK
jgi:proteic killer suppression protein